MLATSAQHRHWRIGRELAVAESEGEARRSSIRGRSPQDLAQSFHLFGRVEAPHAESPIYAELSYGVSQDAELLALAAETRVGQPPPNMLFAAVHFLLLAGTDHPLAAHYPAISGAERPLEPAFPRFRDLCLSQREAIVELLQSRRTQTNVIQRCVCLLPAFGLIANETQRPLAMIEIGPSAGLNLNWDRYHYRYPASGTAAAVEWGDPESGVSLTTVRRGDVALPPLASIEVAWRRGVDLNPIDVRDADAMRWLRALIWPEHVERQERMSAAVAIARQHPPPLIAGEAVELVPGLLGEALDETQGDASIVVFATHALYQLPLGERIRLLKSVEGFARESGTRVDFISMEASGADFSELMLSTYGPDGRRTRKLADANGHGRWLEWLDAG
jgi:hypothetical protein